MLVELKVVFWGEQMPWPDYTLLCTAVLDLFVGQWSLQIKMKSWKACLLKSAQWPRTGPRTLTLCSQDCLKAILFVPRSCFLLDGSPSSLYPCSLSESTPLPLPAKYTFPLLPFSCHKWGCPFHGSNSHPQGANKPTHLSSVVCSCLFSPCSRLGSPQMGPVDTSKSTHSNQTHGFPFSLLLDLYLTNTVYPSLLFLPNSWILVCQKGVWQK